MRTTALLLALAWIGFPARAADLPVPHYAVAALPGGVRLHYMEAGSGPTVVFVHGSLSDYTYWQAEVEAFAAHYHVVAYSRRYDFPNDNPPVRGYSAKTDAEDLAALISALHSGPVFLVGHSYGALTALFLAARHPELVRAAVLAEPPAVSLLASLPGEEGRRAKAMQSDIARRMVAPMHAAFAAGRTEAGVAAFFAYVFRSPSAWSRLSLADKADTLRDAREWQVMMTSGELFPEIAPDAVRRIRTPLLMLSGAKSYPFLAEINLALARLQPSAERVTFPDAGHQMWLTREADCRRATLAFFARHGGPAAEVGAP